MTDQANTSTAEKKVNVGQQPVAAVYAKAFLGAAATAGNAGGLVAELASVVYEVLDRFPDFETLLSSALVSQDDKLAQLDRVFGGRVSPTVLDFLKVISRHGRLDVLRAIQREVERMYEDASGQVRVEIRTATPLDSNLAGKLAGSLRTMLGAEPKLESRVMPELIGGLVLRIGDTVYDGSIQRQLEQVREQMIHRSVHEIQSGRDRFRHSGGD